VLLAVDRQITIGVFTTEVSAVNHSRFLDTGKVFPDPHKRDGVAMRLVLETPYLPLINLDIRATKREKTMR
jgi:hypothetical protein